MHTSSRPAQRTSTFTSIRRRFARVGREHGLTQVNGVTRSRLDAVERVLFLADQPLMKHLQRIGSAAKDYAWPVLRTLFSEVRRPPHSPNCPILGP
jgi:hypothetical protein